MLTVRVGRYGRVRSRTPANRSRKTHARTERKNCEFRTDLKRGSTVSVNLYGPKQGVAAATGRAGHRRNDNINDTTVYRRFLTLAGDGAGGGGSTKTTVNVEKKNSRTLVNTDDTKDAYTALWHCGGGGDRLRSDGNAAATVVVVVRGGGRAP